MFQELLIYFSNTLTRLIVCVVYRLHRLWEEEVAKVGLDKASVFRVVLRFQRTRLILSVIVAVLAMMAAFLGPVIFFEFEY